ncbi:HEPN/Toprim-associated domain-containing protein [Methylobacterium sp. Leaf466]|uniref:HEPN/Toprim-associated domain-containing protein n=1 Tax=Methylobacterium sp. Leaf466 TaxID=1736386 RepID=UPI000A8A8178|nr:HEPN/Toprim-associated domain-containing protein [Methylobacterium sp. Leaf466]
MGTSIELMVSGVSLDYAKNIMGNDYGYLFQKTDVVRRAYDGDNYDYNRHPIEEEDDLAERETAFRRPLARVIPRLEVLGHTLGSARLEYEAAVAEAVKITELMGDEYKTEYLAFDEFCALANLFPLNSLASTYIDYETDDRDTVSQGRFVAHSKSFARVPWAENSDMYWSESSFLSAKICLLSAPSMLLIFALNIQNADAEVLWQFGDIVDSGWVNREVFDAGVRRTQSILIATEGASDARILRRALDLLRPDVTDFFRFIDGDERHHFWGTGNLVRFAEGLLRIDIQNQVLFLLDNDAEGIDAYRKLQDLKMPSNLRSMVLPEIDELRSFPALGPEGLLNSDINGRAAAIECYLDLDLPEYPTARVIWSNYKKDINMWHGALEYKETYDRHFMKQDASTLASGSYDMSKLSKVLDALISEASKFGK